MADPIKVLHVITGLGVGGAEWSLVKLLGALPREEFGARVVSLTSAQPLGENIRLLGYPVVALNRRPGSPDPRLVSGLVGQIRAFRPDILQTWMYHADLLGALAARLAGGIPVVWNIRHSITDLGELKWNTRMVVRLNARLSHRWPQKIICNAERSRQLHAGLGFAQDRMVVIPNGVDTDLFRPDPQARVQLRRELGLSESVVLIGLCARFDPQKDHRTFVRAAGILGRRHAEVHFVLWGKGVDQHNLALLEWILAEGLDDRIHLLGLRHDSHRIAAGLDLATMSSAYGDSFPNVVTEAMASEVPCVVTDVGDAGIIVGSTGKVVPPSDAPALAGALLELLQLPPAERARLGQAARRRAVSEFGIPGMAERYAAVYRDIIASVKGRT